MRERCTCLNLAELNPSHSDDISALWGRCLGDRWPLADEDLRHYLFGQLNGITKTNLGWFDGRGLAAAISSHQSGIHAGLLFVLVSPEHQRKGLGRQLVSEVAARHQSAGAVSLKVGSVNCGYFWPGVPDDCPQAKPFFTHLGFETGSMYSLILDTDEYASSAAWPEGVGIRPLAPSESQDLVAMQIRCGFGWKNDFERPINQGRHADIVVALYDGSIVGALTTKGPEQHHLWRKKLGDDMAEIDNVGVAKPHRRQGIGLALVDAASQLLQERGVRKILIGNTWLKDWYGKLGYQIWSEWLTCKAPLPLPAYKSSKRPGN